MTNPNNELHASGPVYATLDEIIDAIGGGISLEEDYASNAPCDFSGYCAGASCPYFFKCAGA